MVRPSSKALPLTLSCLLLISISCSTLLPGDSSDSTEVTDQPETALSETPELSEPTATSISCEGAELVEQSGRPGALLPVAGLPEALPADVFAATYMTDDREETASLLEGESGPAVLIPVHPSGISGGEFSVTIRADESICGEAAVTVEPIEAAPGAFASYVDALQEYMDVSRRLYGVTREQLLSPEGHDLPVHILPLSLAQHLLDGPEFENSLVSISEGTAPVLEDELGMEIVDAVAAELDLEEQIRAETEEMQALFLSQAREGRARAATQRPQVTIHQIDSPLALDMAMTRQDLCEHKYDVYDEFAGVAKAMESWFEDSLVKFLPPQAKAPFKIRKLLHGSVDFGCVYMLPSEFKDNTTAEGSILWFPQDWEGKDGAVMRTHVLARSKRLDFMKEIEVLMDGIEDQQDRDIISEMAQDLCSQFERCRQDEPVIGPIEYGPITITGTDWTEAETLNEVLYVNTADEAHYYGPERNVTGTGRVLVTTKESEFGDAEPASTELTVLVSGCVDGDGNHPEGSYLFEQEPYTITCRGGISSQSGGGTFSASLEWHDPEACIIRVTVEDVEYLAGRVLQNSDGSVYQGLINEEAVACGVTMSWSEADQDFLSEMRCWTKDDNKVCTGTTSFTMTPR